MVCFIKEAKDIGDCQIDELIGFLMAHCKQSIKTSLQSRLCKQRNILVMVMSKTETKTMAEIEVAEVSAEKEVQATIPYKEKIKIIVILVEWSR